MIHFLNIFVFPFLFRGWHVAEVARGHRTVGYYRVCWFVTFLWLARYNPSSFDRPPYLQQWLFHLFLSALRLFWNSDDNQRLRGARSREETRSSFEESFLCRISGSNSNSTVHHSRFGDHSVRAFRTLGIHSISNFKLITVMKHRWRRFLKRNIRWCSLRVV